MKKELKLITETSYDFEIKESKEDKTLYLMGIFSSAEKKNKNGRVYKKEILEREISKLKEGPIKERTCIGQIGHPEDSPETNLEKAAIITEDLEWKGSDVYGKARVLNTPSGKVLRNLIEDNISIGISSRGLGTLDEDGTVNDDLQILTWDCVANPSNHGSWVNGIYEGKTFTVEDGNIHEPTEKEIMQILESNYNDLKNFLKEYRSSLKEADQIDFSQVVRMIEKQLEPSIKMLKREIKMYDFEGINREWKDLKEIINDINKKIEAKMNLKNILNKKR